MTAEIFKKKKKKAGLPLESPVVPFFFLYFFKPKKKQLPIHPAAGKSVSLTVEY